MKLPRKIRILLLLFLLFILIGITIAGAVLFIHPVRRPQVSIDTINTTITPAMFTKLPPTVDTTSWKTFTDKDLRLTIKYPDSVMLDSRQTSAGRIDAFILVEDKEVPLPGRVPILFIANTHKEGRNGLSAFMKSDCTQPCTLSDKRIIWININNLYGIQNPMPGDVSNYYLTNKNQTGIVVNAYVGGYKNTADIDAQKKIDTFEQMIRTIRFQ
jgi:hypothetical protein